MPLKVRVPAPTARRTYVVQHDHNPMLFLKRSFYMPVGTPAWTPNLDNAHRFASNEHALRFINNWRNGRGYVLPVVEPIRRAA